MLTFGPLQHPDMTFTKTPVGQVCAHCKDEIEFGESGFADTRITADLSTAPIAWHRECFLRTILGSVAHQQRRCPCYGGTGGDHEFANLREAARAAVQLAQATERTDA